MTATTIIAAVPTNQHDHTIGHCRAQRHTLYEYTEHCQTQGTQQQHVQESAVSQPKVCSEEEWTESPEELARWGIQASEPARQDAASARRVHKEAECLRIEDVAKFWQ
ncbi:hypothetical protein COCMIDRAFT_8388 [Bipolaris oryzae ATCC 44560]|uniref:Uncharacterized protein n=1 Tax=Bipolaris oryzae ATCC 44560 TaxID=930090 RepID=W6YRB1_COCMI|nr:uncharacterized protein COCMIDRAFT_8388 [Bipolaris oryzae ATCC 44560]EUC41982.1 hypothetical protein COCMIDRAFT_8388 [Bipolaris oryzae ATCC 44560]